MEASSTGARANHRIFVATPLLSSQYVAYSSRRHLLPHLRALVRRVWTLILRTFESRFDHTQGGKSHTTTLGFELVWYGALYCPLLGTVLLSTETFKHAQNMTNLHVQKVVDNQENARDLVEKACVERFGKGVLEDLAQAIHNETTDNESLMCPAHWDTILCWPDTPAGLVATQNCPSYIVGFIESEEATRRCMQNGLWFRASNASWTNYSSCFKGPLATVYLDFNKTGNISEVTQMYLPMIQTIAQTGYILSLVTLIVAFAIMLFVKKLHCARNILHMHLFASFIMRALTFIITQTTFVDGLGLPSDLRNQNDSLYFDVNAETNNWACKLLTSLQQYFITSNYSWILMEGLYLHNLIFTALFADSCNSIKWYIVIGWGLPIIIIGFWIPARIFLEDAFCWTMHDISVIYLIIKLPITVSILINLLLFLRISLVLYSKLRSPINEDSRRYQKWAKSTLVLVPLFGVHNAIFLTLRFWNKTNKIVEVVWLFCDLLFGSFQGFFVAILYCFLNGEVKSEILPHISKFLTFLATNRYSKYLFPCRKKFLRSVVGRTSVCTTMSCSSLYTNGVLHRNSKLRLDSIPRIKYTGDKSKEHNCNASSRRNSRTQRYSQPYNFSSGVPMIETTLCFEPNVGKSRSESEINEENLKMVPTDF